MKTVGEDAVEESKLNICASKRLSVVLLENLYGLFAAGHSGMGSLPLQLRGRSRPGKRHSDIIVEWLCHFLKKFSRGVNLLKRKFDGWDRPAWLPHQ